MWRVHIKEKYIISRWNFLWMPFEVYSAHVFNNSFGRVLVTWELVYLIPVWEYSSLVYTCYKKPISLGCAYMTKRKMTMSLYVWLICFIKGNIQELSDAITCQGPTITLGYWPRAQLLTCFLLESFTLPGYTWNGFADLYYVEHTDKKQHSIGLYNVIILKLIPNTITPEIPKEGRAGHHVRF